MNKDKVSSEQMIPTTANVSNEAFALVIDNHSLEPRFSADTVLIIEPQVQFNDTDFILVKDNTTNQVNLMQLKVTETGKSLINLEPNQPMVSLNTEQHSILGVLLQSKHTYK